MAILYAQNMYAGQAPGEAPKFVELDDVQFTDPSGQTTVLVNLQNSGMSRCSSLEVDNTDNPQECVVRVVETGWILAVPPFNVVTAPFPIGSLQFTLIFQFDANVLNTLGPPNSGLANPVGVKLYNVTFPHSIRPSRGLRQLITPNQDQFYCVPKTYKVASLTGSTKVLLMPANPTRYRFRISTDPTDTNLTLLNFWAGDASGAAGVYSTYPVFQMTSAQQIFWEEYSTDPTMPITQAAIYVAQGVKPGTSVVSIIAVAFPW